MDKTCPNPGPAGSHSVGTHSVRPDTATRQPAGDKSDGSSRDESHRAEIHSVNAGTHSVRPDPGSRQPTRDDPDNKNRDEQRESQQRESQQRESHHAPELDGQKFRFSVKPSVTVVYGETGMGKTHMLKQMIKEPTPGGPQAVMVLALNPEEWDGSEGDEAVDVPIFTWGSKTGPKLIKKIIRAQLGRGPRSTRPDGSAASHGDSLSSSRTEQTGGQREPNPGRTKRVPAPHLCLILDDLLMSVDWGSKYMGEIFINHRHLNLSLIIVAHNITTRLPPLLKDISRYLVMFELRSDRVAENIFHSFSSGLWESPKELFDATQGMRETRTYCVAGMKEQKYWYASETSSPSPGKGKQRHAGKPAIKAKRPEPEPEAAQP